MRLSKGLFKQERNGNRDYVYIDKRNKNSLDTLRCSPAVKCLMSQNKDLNPNDNITE